MRFDKTEHGHMVVVQVDAPGDDWGKMVEFCLAHKNVIRSSIVFVHGEGGPSAKQRSDLADAVKVMRRGMPVAVLSDSRVTRGVLTAINWLTKKQDESRAFPLNGFAEAMAFIGASDAESRVVRALADKLGAFAKPGRAASM